MITKRIIPCLDVKDGRVVKGVKFEGLSDVSSPVELGKYYSDCGADELVFYDITASAEGRALFTDILTEVAQNIFIPLTVGGGIRSEEVIKKYLDAGVFRVILGTAAVQNPAFLGEMVQKYGEKIAVGVDIKDGMVAIKGWTEVSQESCFDFCEKLQKIGVKTIICTDISKDGLLSGTNLELYKELSEKFSVDIVASGGVTTLDDVKKLADMGMYGAILGKALYTGNIDLKAAVELTKGGK